MIYYKYLHHHGLALIIVVGLLTVLLIVGMAFQQNIQLEFKATTSAHDKDQADVAAQAGIHQAMAFLQHDVWGVSETQAFTCADASGQLHAENGASFDPQQILSRPDGSVAFYSSIPAGFKRIIRPESHWRRPIVRIPLQIASQTQDHPTPQIPTVDGETSIRTVESDLSWVVNYSESYKHLGSPNDLAKLTHFESRPLAERIPVLCGAPLHDEFLPGPFDNHDLWKMRTHYNRVFSSSFSVGRGLNQDANSQSGHWITGGELNHYKTWPAMRKSEEFDYLDTRLCGDAIFHLFRSDLVASAQSGDQAFLSFESGVDPNSTERSGLGLFDPASTRRYLHTKTNATEIHPANLQHRIIATHLGKDESISYTDTRGGALNLNQANNSSSWEQYRNSEGKSVFYNDAKWIYIYTPEGTHGPNLMRYAITILAESGLPNANFSGPPPPEDCPVIKEMENAARNWGLPHYLQALDLGFDAHGNPTNEKHLKDLLGDTPASDWAEQISARMYRYVRGSGDGKILGNGPFFSRAELSLFLRKSAFDPVSTATEKTILYLAHHMSVHSYELLRDSHWESERLILDRAPPTAATSTEFSSSILNENDLNSTESLFSRRCLADRLNALRFTLGPDDTREGQPTPYQFNSQNDDPTRLQSLGSKALSISHLISATLDAPHLVPWNDTHAPEWWQFQDNTQPVPTPQNIYLQLQDRKPDVAAALHTQTMDLTLNVKPTQMPYHEEQGFVGTHSWATRISEVGKVLPRKYTEFPTDTAPDAHFALPTNLGNNAWKFDGLKEYAFVELVANFSATDTPVRQQLMDDFAGNWKRHWKLLVMNPAGSNPNQCDVLKLPSTRVICIDLAADPALASNFGGDALSADSRHEKTRLNRLKVFNPVTMLSSGGSNVMAKTMSIPSVASWNGWMYRWRDDMPKPLTLREIPGEKNGSLRSVEGQDSFARTHPSSYMLVLFDPKELPANTVGQQLRWCAQRLGSTTDTLVLNAVDLPQESLPFEEGWESIDPRNNRDGRISWRKARPYLEADDAQVYLPRSGAIPHDPLTVFQSAGKRQGPFKKFTGSPAFRFLTQAQTGEGDFSNWCDGLNENAIGHFIAGGEKNFDATHQSFGRYDIEDHAGARSWAFACSNESASTLDAYGSSRGFLQFSSDLEKIPLHWMSFTKSATGSGESIPDPNLRHWSDLFRVTSLEQSLTAGYLGGYAYGQPLTPDMYWFYPAMDGLDNDLDGRIDRLTSQSLSPKDSAGHYQSDRKSIGRMNLNEINSPAAFWFAGLASTKDIDGHYRPQNLMTALGHKPHKGYVSGLDILTRLNFQHDGLTPYSSLIWPENSYVDLAASHAHARDQYDHAAEKRMALARTTTVSHSTVYTLCCTGQTIDRLGKVKAQSRIKVTVERTPEGKMNILEWAPLGE